MPQRPPRRPAWVSTPLFSRPDPYPDNNWHWALLGRFGPLLRYAAQVSGAGGFSILTLVLSKLPKHFWGGHKTPDNDFTSHLFRLGSNWMSTEEMIHVSPRPSFSIFQILNSLTYLLLPNIACLPGLPLLRKVFILYLDSRKSDCHSWMAIWDNCVLMNCYFSG